MINREGHDPEILYAVIRRLLMKEWDRMDKDIAKDQNEYNSDELQVFVCFACANSSEEIYDYLLWVETEDYLNPNQGNTRFVAEMLYKYLKKRNPF